MNTCRRLTPQEWEDLGRPQGYPTQEACDDGCGVCCSNVCSSCSWDTSKQQDLWIDKYGNTSHNNQYMSEVGGWYYRRTFAFNFPNPPIPGTWQGLSWNQGYPEALSGTLYQWTKETHYYFERVGNFGSYRVAEKNTYRLYQCQNGGAVDITNQAVTAGPRTVACYPMNQQDPFAPPVDFLHTGTVLDWQTTTDDSKWTGGPETNCEAGMNTASWSTNGNTELLPVLPATSQLLSCTQRICADISKTTCEAANGTWNPGLDCSQVNCNS